MKSCFGINFLCKSVISICTSRNSGDIIFYDVCDKIRKCLSLF